MSTQKPPLKPIENNPSPINKFIIDGEERHLDQSEWENDIDTFARQFGQNKFNMVYVNGPNGKTQPIPIADVKGALSNGYTLMDDTESYVPKKQKPQSPPSPGEVVAEKAIGANTRNQIGHTFSTLNQEARNTMQEAEEVIANLPQVPKLPGQTNLEYAMAVTAAADKAAEPLREKEKREMRARALPITTQEIDSKLDKIDGELATLGQQRYGKLDANPAYGNPMLMGIDMNAHRRAKLYAENKDRIDELERERVALEAQKSMLKSIEKYQEYDRKGDKSGISNFFRAIKVGGDLQALASFGLTKMQEDLDFAQILERAHKGETLVLDERKALQMYTNLQKIAAMDRGAHFNSGLGMQQTFEFMRDIFLAGMTGGASAGNLIAQYGVKGAIKQLGKNTAKKAAEVYLKTALTPSFYKNLTSEIVDNYELKYSGGDTFKADKKRSAPSLLYRTWAETGAEYFTETLSGLIGNVGIAKRIAKTARGKGMLSKAFRKFDEIHDRTKQNPIGGKILEGLSKIGVGNIPEELFEEIAVVPLQSITLGENRMGQLLDPRFYQEVLISTAAIGGMNSATNILVGGTTAAIEKRKTNNKIKELRTSLDESLRNSNETVQSAYDRFISNLENENFYDEEGVFAPESILDDLQALRDATNNDEAVMSQAEEYAKYHIFKQGQTEALRAIAEEELGPIEYGNSASVVPFLDMADGKTYHKLGETKDVVILGTNDKSIPGGRIVVPRSSLNGKELDPIPISEYVTDYFISKPAPTKVDTLDDISDIRQQGATASEPVISPEEPAPSADGKQHFGGVATPRNGNVINVGDTAAYGESVVKVVDIYENADKKLEATIEDENGEQNIVSFNDLAPVVHQDNSTKTRYILPDGRRAVVQSSNGDNVTLGVLDDNNQVVEEIPSTMEEVLALDKVQAEEAEVIETAAAEMAAGGTETAQIGTETTQIGTETTQIGTDDLPRDKEGNIDYDALLAQSPTQFVEQMRSEFGTEVADVQMGKMVGNIDAKIAELQEKVDKEISPNKVASMLKEIRNLQGQRDAISTALAPIEQEEVSDDDIDDETYERLKSRLNALEQRLDKQLGTPAAPAQGPEQITQDANNIASDATEIPAEETSTLVEETSAPNVETSTLVEETSAPNVETSAPNVETSAPVEETSAPNEEIKPVGVGPFEKKNSVLDNTTDTGKTSSGSKENDTATLQDTVSDDKDTTISKTLSGVEEKNLTKPNNNQTETEPKPKKTILENAQDTVESAEIDAAAQEVNTEPTEAQKEAGNYKKGHYVLQGLNISIEQPKGSTRSGKDPDGKKWSVKMNNHYGYIRGTQGKDKDHIDVFIGDSPTSKKVFVVDQVGRDGSFDEHKVMIGFDTLEEAKAAYLSNYEKGWQGLGAITETSMDGFKEWISDGTPKTRRFAEYAQGIPESYMKRAAQWQKKLGIGITVYNSIDDIKDKSVQEQLRAGIGVSGWISRDDNGALKEIGIYLPYINSKADVDKTAIHEIVAHYGLKGLLGEDKYNELCDNVWELMRPYEQDQYLHYPGVNNDSRKAADEYIAHLAETLDPDTLSRSDKSIWEKIVEAVKNIFAPHKKTDVDLTDAISEADLSTLLKASYARLAENSGKKTQPKKTKEKPTASKEVSSTPSKGKVQDQKIEDFGEKIGGARKDVARQRVRDAVNLTKTDLQKLADPDKILSKANIIKSLREGTMTKEDAITLMAMNNTVRCADSTEKYIMMPKYRDMALAWTNGQSPIFHITDKDIEDRFHQIGEHIKARMSDAQVEKHKQNIKKYYDILYGYYSDYIKTYRDLDYPNVERKLAGAIIRKFSHDDSIWVLKKADARRGRIFRTMEAAIAYMEREYPVVVAKAKEDKTSADDSQKVGHLRVVKDGTGWFRIKSSEIPGEIYFSKSFSSRKGAEEYLQENRDMLIAKEQRAIDALMGSNIGMAERQGPDYRNGKDVTSDEYLKAFGFRGVEFGNWVPQAERQMYLNKSYDAIMDICSILGITPKAFSLGGKLAIAFGARGHSKAMAHYESSKQVINLTRMKGVGSFAHEWFHAIDNYLARENSGNTMEFVTEKHPTKRQELYDAFNEFVSKMNTLDYTRRSRRAGDYWGSVIERAARMFESYIYTELGAKDISSPLLVDSHSVLSDEYLVDSDISSYPIPTAEETRQIKPYLDKIFATIQEEVDADDNHILFRVAENVGSFEDAINIAKDKGYENLSAYPDVTNQMLEDALTSGRIMVYSKDPIAGGTTVSPSVQRASELSGPDAQIYSKDISIDQVAWETPDEGTYTTNDDIRFRFIGEQGAANLDRAEEATIRMDNLAVAREMETAGKDAKTIKIATGWERGADKKWRYEVDDDIEFDSPVDRLEMLKEEYGSVVRDKNKIIYLLNMYPTKGRTEQQKEQIKQIDKKHKSLIAKTDALLDTIHEAERELSEMSLEDLIGEDNNLFKEYPQLADINVSFIRNSRFGNYKGFYSPSENTIWISPDNGQPASTLVHELQHAIQHIEGFARGGNTSTGNELRDKAKAWSWKKQLEQTEKEHPELAGSIRLQATLEDEYKADGMEDKMPSKEIRTTGFNLYVRGYDNEGHESAYDQWEKIGLIDNPKDYSTYKRLAGEVEARNVQTRKWMPASVRRESLAVDTEYDVSREDQIFIMDGIAAQNDVRFRISDQNTLRDNLQAAITGYIVGTNTTGDVITTDDMVNTIYDYVENAEESSLKSNLVKELDAYEQNVQSGKLKDSIISPEEILIENVHDIINMYSDEVMFRISNENQRVFISNAEQAVRNINMGKAPAEQWLKTIEKAGGLKAGEDKWIGLSDWLKSKGKDTLTKDEVLQFIGDNRIIIQERHYLEEIDYDADDQKQIDAMNEEFLALRGEAEEAGEWIHDAAEIAYMQMADKYGDDFTIGFGVDSGKLYVANIEAASTITGIAPRPERLINATRLNYTTHGLDNNHEIALIVPTIESWNRTDDLHFGDAGDGRAIAWIRFGETTIQDPLTPEAVAAARKVLVIDEIQSERHQEGREKGYKSDFVLTKEKERLSAELDKKYERRGSLIRERESERDGEMYEIERINQELLEVRNNRDYDRLMAERDAITQKQQTRNDEILAIGSEIRELEKELVELAHDIGFSIAIPDAPFEKNWHELAMKRMLRYAAENGYNKIAWTKGEQQAERYIIGNIVSSIMSYDTADGKTVVIRYKDNESTYLSVNNNGQIIDGRGPMSYDMLNKNLSDVVGKEISKKILNGEGDDITYWDGKNDIPAKEISGEGLRVGGEGMKSFYDRMLPSFMNKYGKKWGVKVEDIFLPNLESNGITMHSIDVTPEMKESVMQGQVMFRADQDPLVQNEMQSIIDAAKANGTYMKAPNGKPSNLNPEQWAMVRTKNFKRWFGDWMLPYVTVNKVAVSKEHPFDITKKVQDTKIDVVAHAREKGVIRTLTNDETNGKGNIIISKTAIEKIVDDAYKIKDRADLMLGAISKLPELIKKSNLGEEHFSYTKGSDSVRRPENGINEKETIFRYFGAIESDGETYRVKITVKRDNGNQSQRAYTYEVMKIELSSGNTDANKKALPTLDNSISFAKLLDGVENDKKNGEKLLDFSKVVDENGEPMVVYHGSVSENITAFDKEKIRINETDASYNGFWFSTDPDTSPAWRNAKRVYPVFLNLRNPIKRKDAEKIAREYLKTDAAFDSIGDNGIRGAADAVRAKLKHEGYDGVIHFGKPSINIDEFNKTGQTIFSTSDGVRYIISKEEDGINVYEYSSYEPDYKGDFNTSVDTIEEFMKDSYFFGEEIYVVFEPTQIKSATDNIGTFDPANPDIRFRAVPTTTAEDIDKNGFRSYLSQKDYERMKKEILKGAPILRMSLYTPDEYISSVIDKLTQQSPPDATEALQMASSVRDAFTRAGIVLDMSDNEIIYALWKEVNPSDAVTIKERLEHNHKSNDVRYRIDSTIGPNTNDIKLSRGEQFRENWVDKMVTVKMFQDLVKKRGGSVEDNLNPYITENLSLGRQQRENELFQENIYRPMVEQVTAVEKLFVKEGLASKEDAYKAVNDFLYARHAPERNRHVMIGEIEAYITRAITPEEMKFISGDNPRAEIRALATRIYNVYANGVADTSEVFAKNMLNTRYKSKDLNERLKEFRNKFLGTVKGAKEYTEKVFNSKKGTNRSGMSDKEAKEILNKYYVKSTQAELDKLSDLVRESTHFTLDTWYKYNMISAKERDNYKSMYKYYIPLRNWEVSEDIDYSELTNQAFNHASEIISTNKKAHGRSSRADNPLAYIASLAQSAIVLGNKNQVRLNMYRLVLKNLNILGDIATIPKVYFVKNNATGEITQTTERPEQELFDQGLVETKTNKDYRWHKTGAEYQAHLIPVIINGDRHLIEMRGEFGVKIASAINNTNSVHLSYLDATRPVTQWLSATRTSYNPEFIPTNFARDFMFGNMAYAVEGGNILKLNRNLGRAFKAINRSELGTKYKDQYDRYYEEFMNEGAQTGFMNMRNIETMKKDLEKMHKQMLRAGGKLSDMKNFAIKFGSAGIQYLNAMSENAMRFAVYLTEREKGASAKQAAFAAKEITVNFNRKGRYTENMGALYSFFNASVQGTARLYDLTKKHGKRTAVALAALTTIKLASDLICVLFAGDDYDELSDYVKFSNILIPIGVQEDGRMKFLKIPMAQGVRAVTNIADVTVDVIRGTKTVGEAAKTFFLNNLGEHLPLSFEAIDLTGRDSMASFITPFLPSVAVPFYESWRNVDFKGDPIYREDYTLSSKEYLPRYTRAYGSTNPAYVALSRGLNALAGGNDELTSAIKVDENGNISRRWYGYAFDINPAIVEHIIDGFMGGITTFPSNTIKTITSAVSDEKEVELYNVPIVNRFVSVPTYKEGYDLYFRTSDLVRDIQASEKAVKAVGDMDAYSSIRSNGFNREITRVYKIYDKRVKYLKDLKENSNLSTQQMKDIEARMDQVMKEASAAFEKIYNKYDNNIERYEED